MSDKDNIPTEVNSNCDSSSTELLQLQPLNLGSYSGTDETCSTSEIQPEKKAVGSLTGTKIITEFGDMSVMDVDSSVTSCSLVGNESDEIPSQNLSGSADGQSTVSHSVEYTETKIVHLLSFDQSFECDDQESETVSSASQSSNSPSYVLSNLLADIKNCNDSVLRTVSGSWISTYNSNKHEALKALVELILHSAGCKHALPMELFLDLENSSIPVIENWICQKLDAVTFEPNIWDDNYIENIRKFLKSSLKSEVLANIPFVNKVVYFLQAMITCLWSSSRFTAAIFGGILVQRYRKLFFTLEAHSSNVLSPSTSLAALRQREIMYNNVEKLLNVILITLRDKEVVIRKFMFEVYWKWFENWPAVFVRDKYLNHIYFAFFDDCLQIRSLAVKATKRLVVEYKSSGKLESYIEKAVPRVFERLRDVNATVAVEAIRAVSDIQRVMSVEEILKYGSPEKIYLLIFNSEGSVASEASLFLYNSAVLSKHHSDPENFIRELVTFLFEAGKMTKKNQLENKLLSSMFKHAHKQLTHWRAWKNVLLGDSMTYLKHLEEIACRFLHAVVCHSTGRSDCKQHYPPCPPVVAVEKVKLEPVKMKKAKEQHELNKDALTRELAPHLVQIWEKYKDNQNCLGLLISIPQHFSDQVENIDMKKLCIYLIKLEQDIKVIRNKDEDIFCSLSVMHTLMSGSIRWRQTALQLEKCLFFPVVKNLLDACQKLETSPNRSNEALTARNLLKKAAFLSTYFDMTSTEMPNTSLKAFQYGASKLNSQIITALSYTCLYVAEWELKNIGEKKYAGDELKAKLYSLSSHVNTMYKLLNSLLPATDVRITDVAYTVLSDLLILFRPLNSYVKPYSVLHLPLPSLLVSEWLSFYLTPERHWQGYSKDASWFSRSVQSVKKFCTLVITGTLHISYLSTLLPYFAFYDLKKNYNPALEEIVKSTHLSGFALHLLNAFASLLRHCSHSTLEKMAMGTCFVVVSKVKPVYVMNNLATRVVWEGLLYITKNKDLTLFIVLAPFVKFMSQYQVTTIKTIVMETFHLHLDHPCVKKTVDAFNQRTKQPIGPGKSGPTKPSSKK